MDFLVHFSSGIDCSGYVTPAGSRLSLINIRVCSHLLIRQSTVSPQPVSEDGTHCFAFRGVGCSLLQTQANSGYSC